jgi:AcrR family transcriptional regulator
MAKATKRTGSDDAALLRLLWRPGPAADPSRPGPKASLTLETIVAAGIAVADDRTGPALSMRAVADRLGCTPMALYTHVADKQELLRLMYDRAHAEFVEPGAAGDAGSAGDADAAGVRAGTRALAALYADHYWLSDVSWARPVLGPHEQRVLESLLEQLAPMELPGGRAGTLASALFALARSTGRMVADARHADRTAELTESQWWQRQSAAMAELVPDFAQRFPLSASMDADTGPAEDAAACPNPDAGYLEHAAWAQLARAVDLLLAGATAPAAASADQQRDGQSDDHGA